jgi:ferredoxin
MISLECDFHKKSATLSFANPERTKGETMPEAVKTKEGLEKTSLSVGGMSCAACVVRVEKALAGLEGVEQAAVNFATEKLRDLRLL